MSLLEVNILEGLAPCSLRLAVTIEDQTAGLSSTEEEISPESQTPHLVLWLDLVLDQSSVEPAFISVESPGQEPVGGPHYQPGRCGGGADYHVSELIAGVLVHQHHVGAGLELEVGPCLVAVCPVDRDDPTGQQDDHLLQPQSPLAGRTRQSEGEERVQDHRATATSSLADQDMVCVCTPGSGGV